MFGQKKDGFPDPGTVCFSDTNLLEPLLNIINGEAKQSEWWYNQGNDGEYRIDPYQFLIFGIELGDIIFNKVVGEEFARIYFFK